MSDDAHRPVPTVDDLELRNAIDRMVPVLERFSSEEIDAMRERLEGLLDRRPPVAAAASYSGA